MYVKLVSRAGTIGLVLWLPCLRPKETTKRTGAALLVEQRLSAAYKGMWLVVQASHLMLFKFMCGLLTLSFQSSVRFV
jgi:hypothetical protein